MITMKIGGGLETELLPSWQLKSKFQTCFSFFLFELVGQLWLMTNKLSLFFHFKSTIKRTPKFTLKQIDIL